MSIFNFLQNMDRRILYLWLAGVIIITISTGWVKQKPEIKPAVQDAYDTIESIKPGKIALISIYWGAGTLGENMPQTEAILRHLFSKGIPVAIVPWDQTGNGLVYEKAVQIAAEMHKVYGKDWMMFGFNPAWSNVVPALGAGIPVLIKKDRFGTPTSKFPMFAGKYKQPDGTYMDRSSIKNVGVVVEITPSATVNYWISFVGQPFKIPIVYCPTGVMAPEGYNFLDAHLVSGMLPGVIGAAQYEVLQKNENGFALKAANALSVSHVLILVLIILGNIGYLISRREARRAQR